MPKKKLTKKQEEAAKAEFSCTFCHKVFSTEKVMINHLCEKKRRWLWKDEKQAMMGFRAYQRFYQLTFRSKNEKTQEEFIDSRYYTGFVKFGRHLLNINAIDPQGFVDFLVKAGVKLDDWCAEWAYETWVRELGKKESPYKAVERNVLLMEQWSRDTGEEWQQFFHKVNPQLATKWIRAGRISPWLLYTVGTPLLDRLSDEHLGLIKEWVDPVYWSPKLKLKQEEVSDIKAMLISAGVQ